MKRFLAIDYGTKKIGIAITDPLKMIVSPYITIINKMMPYGIEGLILGCTEIGLLIKEKDIPIKIFDTTIIHAKKAVEYALK